jgi:EAL domain-containing protein (putative c-di-GMP-specific phosphodiesterase class I)
MYHAKRSGRDNAQLYSASLTQVILQRMELDSSLRVALERNQFELVYQPQIDVATGRVRSVEALIRWNHPVRGLVSPLEFIALAEENGLIHSIGMRVLRIACADAARWHAQGLALTVAVNLSPLQFNSQDLPQQVIEVLAETGLPPAYLELEVTEGAVMENTKATQAALQALHAQGLRIALDDFGTGYSSLADLTRMPISNIKVNRCFVSGLLDGGESEAIVRAVLAMAHSLGMQVTAEGVETIEQARALEAMACDCLQGFYFSRPVAAAAIASRAAQHWTLTADDATAASSARALVAMA